MEYITCNHNQLIYIPILPNLISLKCSHNQLTRIPVFPKIKLLHCMDNQLTSIPVFPLLESFYYYDNPVEDIIVYCCFTYDYYIFDIQRFHRINEQIHRFRELFYALKYKKQFRLFLWDRIRRPKIEVQYHPTKLVQFIQEHPEDWNAPRMRSRARAVSRRASVRCRTCRR